MITIGAIHTGATSLAPMLEEALRLELKEFKLINIIDDSLINTVKRDGCITEKTAKRVFDLCEALVLAGADVVVDTCSSIGDAVELADQLLDKPILRIDQGMIHQAVQHHTKIGVLASLSTTLVPTVSCVKRTAARMGTVVDVRSQVADGAFEQWASGDLEGHDNLLVEGAKQLGDVEVILLAQASMSRVRERLERETGKLVFASPAWCAKQLHELFPDA